MDFPKLRLMFLNISFLYSTKVPYRTLEHHKIKLQGEMDIFEIKIILMWKEILERTSFRFVLVGGPQYIRYSKSKLSILVSKTFNKSLNSFSKNFTFQTYVRLRNSCYQLFYKCNKRAPFPSKSRKFVSYAIENVLVTRSFAIACN